MHSTIARNAYEHLLNKTLFRCLANRSDAMVFVCKNQMDYWVKEYGIREKLCRYIYNGIDMDYWSVQSGADENRKTRRSIGLEESDIVVATCGGLRPEKGHVYLLGACAELLGKGFPIKALIIGDGPERRNIDRYAKQSGIENHVIVTGFQRDVRPFLALADIVAMPSLSEAFSIAALEAMALGKPIVASRVGGTSEQVISGQNGFLYPPGDSHALAECLEKVISQGLAEIMGQRSLHLVREKFTLPQMVASYEELLLQQGVRQLPQHAVVRKPAASQGRGSAHEAS